MIIYHSHENIEILREHNVNLIELVAFYQEQMIENRIIQRHNKPLRRLIPLQC